MLGLYGLYGDNGKENGNYHNVHPVPKIDTDAVGARLLILNNCMHHSLRVLKKCLRRRCPSAARKVSYKTRMPSVKIHVADSRILPGYSLGFCLPKVGRSVPPNPLKFYSWTLLGM